MKEILYIQAGTFPNHIGTHFWNTQETHFTYEEDEEPDVNHDISFWEGQTLKGESTYCPRLLLFDRKAQFGGVSAVNGLYGEDEDAVQDEIGPSLWAGPVLEVRQSPIPKSAYHARLEAEAEDDEEPNDAPKEPRYWSDYSRIFFHPRSLQKLQDLPEQDSGDGEWGKGQEEFARYNEETGLMEDAFRLSVEECDNLQGIQLTSDVPTFGGFTTSFLTAYRDEFPKLPCLSFSLLSASLPTAVDFEEKNSLRKVVNDALALHSLSQLSTLDVPLQVPSFWSGRLLGALTSAFNRASMFHASTLLSTHIESATLPLRLKGSSEDLHGLCDQLSLGGNLRFAHLSGIFPLAGPVKTEWFEDGRIDFSTVPQPPHQSTKVDPLEYARVYVSRSFTGADRRSFDAWVETRRPPPHMVHAPPYPLPSSFPMNIISSSVIIPSVNTWAPASLRSLPTTRVLSSLHTSSGMGTLLEDYARIVDDVVRRHDEVIGRLGMEPDEMREVGEGLWEVRYALGSTEAEMESEEAMGEDEE